jgi:hypothetical protein
LVVVVDTWFGVAVSLVMMLGWCNKVDGTTSKKRESWLKWDAGFIIMYTYMNMDRR